MRVDPLRRARAPPFEGGAGRKPRPPCPRHIRTEAILIAATRTVGTTDSEVARGFNLAFVIEDEAIAPLRLAALGFTTEAYHPHQVTRVSVRKVTQGIRTGRYGFIWLELPSSGKTVLPKRWNATITDRASGVDAHSKPVRREADPDRPGRKELAARAA